MTRTFVLLAAALVTMAAPVAAQVAYAVRSDGNDAFDDHLYRIDLATAVATPIGPTGFEDVESLAFGEGCTSLYGVDDTTDVLLTCDAGTGGCTAVGPLGTDITDTGLAFTSPADLFLSTDAPKNPSLAFRVDPLTGLATALGDQGQEVTAVAYTGGVLYGLGGDGRNNLVTLDPATGQATPVGPLVNVALGDGGLDADSAGILWGVADNGLRNPSVLFTVDPLTGTATVVGTIHLDGGPDLVGFESLVIPDGSCRELGAAVPAIPALSWPALAGLAAALALVGARFLR